MATLAELPVEEFEGAVHLLLIGPSKTGKTDFVAQTVKDGFTVLYIDNDNGLNTLRRKLEGDAGALSRVHYIKTQDIWNFSSFFFARDRFQWNATKDSIFTAAKADDDDDIHEIYRTQIPQSVIIVLDSWTSVCIQLLQDSARLNQIPYENFNEKGQQVYGDANRRADVLCMNIQRHSGHVIVQAHQEQYEILEKPKGKMTTKQNEMIIKDNQLIPSSVSKPHGFKMPKYFNEVGWLRVNALGKFLLDFRQQTDRVGGGTPMKEGDPREDMRFSKLFATPKPVGSDWIRTVKAKVFKEEAEALAEANRIKAEEAKAAKLAASSTPKVSTGFPPKGQLK
jgi:hypothetical protein